LEPAIRRQFDFPVLWLHGGEDRITFMFNLQTDEVDNARKALIHHGLSGFFPTPPEWDLVVSDWQNVNAIICSIDLDQYSPYENAKTYAPKKSQAIRPVSAPHVQDLIIYTALVLILRDRVEDARLDSQLAKSFSYRATKAPAGRLYQSVGAYEAYREKTKARLELSKTKFIATADIADFYPRIYQHRLENALTAASSSQRERETCRVLMKLLNAFSGGTSYGIPTGPYASRTLGEAVLIDVDASLHGGGVDFVRWVDDFTIFAKTEEEAKEAIFFISSWLNDHHGLSLNQEKTRILTKKDFVNDVWKTYDQEHDEFRRRVKEINDAISYDEEPDEDDGFDELDVEGVFDLAMEIDIEPKFGLIRFLLERIIIQPGVDDETRTNVVRKAMKNVWKLTPLFDAIVKAIDEDADISKTEMQTWAKRIHAEILERKLFIPGFIVAWFCWFVGERRIDDMADKLKHLSEHTNDNAVLREALYAISRVGSRAHALTIKERYSSVSDVVRPCIVAATKKLGADERKFWRLKVGISDPYEKLMLK
jgi:hypothetical protein